MKQHLQLQRMPLLHELLGGHNLLLKGLTMQVSGTTRTVLPTNLRDVVFTFWESFKDPARHRLEREQPPGRLDASNEGGIGGCLFGGNMVVDIAHGCDQ